MTKINNRHKVTVMKDGKEVKLFIEANPADLINWKGEAQQLEHYKKPELKQDHKKAESQNQETAKRKKMSV